MTSISFFIILSGLYYYLTEVNGATNISRLSLVSVLLYVAAFSIGLGPVPWVIVGEIIPLKTRSFSSSIAAIGVWMSNLLVTKEIFDLEAAITNYGTYWLFGGINLGCCLFVIFVVPETKGRTLEQIEKLFEEEKDVTKTSLE